VVMVCLRAACRWVRMLPILLGCWAIAPWVVVLEAMVYTEV
jgi:hypothetical protein